MRRRLVPLLLTFASCSAEPAAPRFDPGCTVNQFRACETESCRGAQQCVEPGVWRPCSCTVLDAGDPHDADAGDPHDADAGEPHDADAGEPHDADAGDPHDADAG